MNCIEVHIQEFSMGVKMKILVGHIVIFIGESALYTPSDTHNRSDMLRGVVHGQKPIFPDFVFAWSWTFLATAGRWVEELFLDAATWVTGATAPVC